MNDETMKLNDSASDETRGENFGELNAFEDFNNPDSIPSAAQKLASDVTLPVPLPEADGPEDTQAISSEDASALTTKVAASDENGTQPVGAASADVPVQMGEPLGLTDENAAENTAAEEAPESEGAPSVEAPAGEQAAEMKKEATQPVKIPQSSPAWFSEIASFNEKTAGSAPKPPTAQPSRDDYFTGAWVKPASAQKNGESTWNTKPYGAWMPPGAPKPPVLQDDIPTIPPEVSPPAPISNSQPLPLKRVTETDPAATQLSTSAFAQRQEDKTSGTQPVRVAAAKSPRPAESKAQAARVPSQTKPVSPKLAKRKSFKSALPFLFVFLALLFIGFIFVGFQYFRIASTLPSVAELRSRASQFETTRILDRRGNILYEINDPNAGKRTYVPLEKISPYLIAATIATEDKEYYNHPGFDLLALARALWTNYTSGEIVSGASTITQQLARMLLLREERFEQTYDRKAREIILAAEITRRYSKEEVLELYLNEIFYGNLSYGIEAAAETYFNTTAADLQLWQSSFLAGLPQSPAVYDIYNNR